MDTKHPVPLPLQVSEIRYIDPSQTPAKKGIWTRIELSISGSLRLLAMARLSAAALVLITTTFFLLCSFTFSWLNIVANENVLWVPKLAGSYAYMYWVVFLLNALTLLPAFHQRNSRWLIETLLVALLTVGLLMYRVYRLTDLPPSGNNIAWTIALAFPLLCFGIHDLVMYGNPELWRRQGETWKLPLRFVFVCGGMTAAWYAAIATIRHPELLTMGNPYGLVVTTSMAMHACAFTCIAAGLSCIEDLANRFHFNGRTRWLISLWGLWILASVLLRKLVAPALSFNSVWADVWAGVYPLAFIAALAGWHVRSSSLRKKALPGRVEETLSGFVPKKRIWTGVAAVLAFLTSILVPLFIERVDWNFLFQRIAVVAVWLALLIVTWRLFVRPAAGPSLVKSIAAFVVTGACLLVLAQSSRAWHRLGWRNTERATAAYSGVDVSFQSGQLFFRPAIHDDDATGLFPYLLKNALISAPIGPPEVKLASSLTPALGPRPDIYIVVIDCMRRDYVSAYNPRVTFTPHIKEFAKDSFVFENAYTNYAGTALSEPAIWAGAMMPSKHYVSPFSEVNALERLTTTDSYQRVITSDRILRLLLTPQSTDKWINQQKDNQYFGLDLRDTVRQLNDFQNSNREPGPLFFYTQPQNLHPVTLHEVSQSGKEIGGSYPGFNARYADELWKVDEAFGQFVANLKARGRFDNSIIILTADHGEWLGEYGRWGHAQSLLPPVIEVPLLVHLPKNLSKDLFVNTKQTVFLTDITPSLYYLLGHSELNKNEFFGRPLFTQTAAEQANYSVRYHLVMSSYGAVFGILDDNGHTLYEADAVDGHQALFNLNDDHYGIDNVIDQQSQPRFEQLVRGSINRLSGFYGYSSDRH